MNKTQTLLLVRNIFKPSQRRVIMSLKEAKLVYLPKIDNDDNIVKFLKAPNPRTGTTQTLILANDQLYEIERFDGDNPHDSKNHQRATTKKDSKAVRSMILENTKDKKAGLILEQEEIYISKKFNFVFCLISFFWSRPDGSRYQTIDDLIDTINEEFQGLAEIPENIVSKSLKLICDVIEEGHQEFYKYSKDKTSLFLKQKLQAISDSFPESIYIRLIRPSICPTDIDQEIPPKIEQLAKQKYSIFLLSSYLKPEVQQALLDAYDFNELDSYTSTLEDERQQKKLAEEQINDLNTMNSNNKRTLNQSNSGSNKKVPVKKNTKKLSMGPLDGFFKKK